jgi:hypothetical protein
VCAAARTSCPLRVTIASVIDPSPLLWIQLLVIDTGACTK